MGTTRGLLRYRYLLLAVIASSAAAWLIWYLMRVYQQDYLISVFGGYSFFGWLPTYHHSGLHLYATNPEIQMGPLYLALVGPVDKLLPGFETGRVVFASVPFVCAVVSAWTLERTLLAVGVERVRAQWSALTGGVLFVGAFAVVSFYAHAEDALAVTLTLLAVRAVAERRAWWVAPLLLAAATSCKPWAVAVFPILLVTQRRALLLAVGLAAVPWLPFLIGAPGTLNAIANEAQVVMPHSVMSLGITVGSSPPPHVQALSMLVGVCFAAFAVSRGQWLFAPLAAFSGRLLLDPRWFMYYGLAAVVGAVLWDASRQRFPAWTVWTLLAEGAVQQWAPTKVGAAVNLVYALSIVGALMLAPSRHRDEQVVPAADGRARPVEPVLSRGQVL